METTIGERLKEVRAKSKLSQPKFALSLDVSTPYIAGVEGGASYPNYKFLQALKEKYNVSSDWLLFGDEQGGAVSGGLTDHDKEIFNDENSRLSINTFWVEKYLHLSTKELKIEIGFKKDELTSVLNAYNELFTIAKYFSINKHDYYKTKFTNFDIENYIKGCYDEVLESVDGYTFDNPNIIDIMILNDLSNTIEHFITLLPSKIKYLYSALSISNKVRTEVIKTLDLDD